MHIFCEKRNSDTQPAVAIQHERGKAPILKFQHFEGRTTFKKSFILQDNRGKRAGFK